ncbi:MAG: hypothetical protein M2R45_00686 [Verrucomicrobia subdivision 3 bacterium]|nr:hypothetical protein [Limisphaerales bacterium]MCS1414430.1 hypothetical protein [Limisphaerales bacterium]
MKSNIIGRTRDLVMGFLLINPEPTSMYAQKMTCEKNTMTPWQGFVIRMDSQEKVLRIRQIC